MKKFAMAMLSLLMVAGCSQPAEDDAKKDAEKVEDTVKDDTQKAENDVKDDAEKVEGETVKTGSVETEDGATVEATIVDKDGKMKSITIDEIDPDGNSKKEKSDYMKDASGIGKEWNEQVQFLEQYIMDHGVDSIEVDKDGYAVNEDLKSGCTIKISSFLDAVKNAEKN